MNPIFHLFHELGTFRSPSTATFKNRKISLSIGKKLKYSLRSTLKNLNIESMDEFSKIMF